MNYYELSSDIINPILVPLEERYYDSPLHLEYCQDEHFHHSAKGCVVDMMEVRTEIYPEANRRPVINKYCKTHNVKCSKTGWELGWFMGTYSREEPKYCIDCGIKLNFRGQKRCSDCKHTYLYEKRNAKNVNSKTSDINGVSFS